MLFFAEIFTEFSRNGDKLQVIVHRFLRIPVYTGNGKNPTTGRKSTGYTDRKNKITGNPPSKATTSVPARAVTECSCPMTPSIPSTAPCVMRGRS